jgi:hypothetical protein
MCDRFFAFTNSLPLPPIGSTLGFFFSKYDAIPELVWVQYAAAIEPETYREYPEPQLASYLNTRRPEYKDIEENHYRGSRLQRRLKLYSEERTQFEDLELNRCIEGLTESYPYDGTWFGSFVVLAVKGVMVDDVNRNVLEFEGERVGGAYVDVNLADYRAIVDHCEYFPLGALYLLVTWQ